MVTIALLGRCRSSLIGCWSAGFRCFAARLDQVQGKAVNVFGTPQDALAWLNRPAIGLGRRVPCQLLSNDDGYLQILERIEYGVYC